MHARKLSPGFSPGGRPLTLLALLLSLLAGCGIDQTDPVPTYGGAELYPLRVGDFRIFAVQDSTWRQNQVTVSGYQQRETVTDSFPSPSVMPGQAGISYRVLRARRATATASWVDDSVFVLTSLPRALLLSRNNQRTLELLFPVRDSLSWNRYSFDVLAADSLKRRYRRVGRPVSLRLPNGQLRPYERSVRTYDFDAEDAFYTRTYEQIFVPGVGPVQRRRRNLSTFTFGPSGEQIADPNFIYAGSIRREVLLEYGRRK